VIFSIYENEYQDSFSDSFYQKAAINNLKKEQLQIFKNDEGVMLEKGVIQFADGIIQGSEELSENIRLAIEESKKPFISTPKENFLPNYIDFYKTFLS
jgi:starch synthase